MEIICGTVASGIMAMTLASSPINRCFVLGSINCLGKHGQDPPIYPKLAFNLDRDLTP